MVPMNQEDDIEKLGQIVPLLRSVIPKAIRISIGSDEVINEDDMWRMCLAVEMMKGIKDNKNNDTLL